MDQESRSISRVTPQLVMGLLIVVLGVLLTLENIGVADVGRYVARYWPAALIIVGLMKLWQWRRDGFGAFGGLMFVLFGTLLLLDSTGVVAWSWEDMWPLILVFIGGSMVWRGMQRPRPSTDDSTAAVSGMAVLGGVKRRNNAQAFKGGDLTAIMGGCEIDLRQAAINGEAVIDVFAMWGGIELRVPENWTVISRVTPLLGGVEDKSVPPPPPAVHRLVLRGMAIMGGIEVKN
jgi:hypothetical protein